jgi:nicotinate-nucleotide adenylyltransferase
LQKIFRKDHNKIGILGGTFDPPHKGHLYISKIALKKLKLNKLMWVITKKNPLKQKPYLSTKARIDLSTKMIKNEKKIFVRYFSDKIKSINTFNLLKYIKKRNQKTKLFFLIGADNLAKFHKWKNWKKIPKLAKIVIFPRQNYSIKSLSSIASKKLNRKDLIYMNSKKINISSSLIRKFW